jgi:hypothetical protein
MIFVTKWLQFEHSREWEKRCDTKSKAESVAFDRIDERCEDVWIEDENGALIASHEELKRRRKDASTR